MVSEAFLAWLVSLSCTELAAFLFYFSIFTIKNKKKKKKTSGVWLIRLNKRQEKHKQGGRGDSDCCFIRRLGEIRKVFSR